jgi:hypothetical protein
MSALLDVLREVVLAAALAWVGVTVEAQPHKDVSAREARAAAGCNLSTAVTSQPVCGERNVMFSVTSGCPADK